MSNPIQVTWQTGKGEVFLPKDSRAGAVFSIGANKMPCWIAQKRFPFMNVLAVHIPSSEKLIYLGFSYFIPDWIPRNLLARHIETWSQIAFMREVIRRVQHDESTTPKNSAFIFAKKAYTLIGQKVLVLFAKDGETPLGALRMPKQGRKPAAEGAFHNIFFSEVYCSVEDQWHDVVVRMSKTAEEHIPQLEIYEKIRNISGLIVPRKIAYSTNGAHKKSHIKIIEICQAFDTDLSEYLRSGLIHSMASEVIREKRIRIATQIVQILARMHSKSFFHTDLKTNNIVINRKSLEVGFIDFEHCKMVIGIKIMPERSAYYYASPEEIRTLLNYDSSLRPVNKDGLRARELWALGIVLHVLFFQKYLSHGLC